MKIIHLFWAGARELGSSWLLATGGSLFSSWFRLLFRFFHCHFLRSFFWLCSLLWGRSILGFDISIINLILWFVRTMFFINMMTPSTVCHVYVTFSTPNFQAIFRIEHLASDIRAFRSRMVRFLSVARFASSMCRRCRLDGCNTFAQISDLKRIFLKKSDLLNNFWLESAVFQQRIFIFFQFVLRCTDADFCDQIHVGTRKNK